jgi:hypothetical protein
MKGAYNMETILRQLRKPLGAALVAGFAGLLLGLLWAWVIQPVKLKDADPSYLSATYKEDYMRMAIDSYGANPDPNLAVQRFVALGPDAPQILENIRLNPEKQNPALVDNYYQTIEAIPGLLDTSGIPPAASPNIFRYAIIGFGVILILGVAGALIYFMRPSKRTDETSPAMQAQEYSRQTERTDFESMGIASPITQTMTTYVSGDDLYDESFSIDSQAGEFMGEYGVGISETIGVGEPKKVTALEIWLFDKNDIKTATKVLMSAHAFNDPAIRQRLEAKGELVLVEPQIQVVLETATLQLLATIADVEYGDGPLPPDSYFERLTLELAVWPKDEQI